MDRQGAKKIVDFTAGRQAGRQSSGVGDQCRWMMIWETGTGVRGFVTVTSAESANLGSL